MGLALISACVEVAETRPDSPATLVTGTTSDGENPGWEQLDSPPVQSRIWNTTTWTGSELLVWGGVVPERGLALDDGAAFDPRSREWRSLAASPLDRRVGHTAVWTGEKLFVWGGHPGGTGFRPRDRFNDGAAYDPETDTWSPIADAPLTGGPGYTAVWAGTEMVVLGGNDGYMSSPEMGLGEGATYDPSSDTWREISFPTPMLTMDAVWTGSEVLAYAVEEYLGTLHGLGYDPLTESWRELPDSPISTPMPDVELIGDHLVVWSYDPGEEGVAALRVDNEEWQSLPRFPGRPSDGTPNAAALGPDLLLMQEEAEIALYSIGGSEWHPVPWPAVEIGPFVVPPVWTGDEALFYEGNFSRFWSYRPDPALLTSSS